MKLADGVHINEAHLAKFTRSKVFDMLKRSPAFYKDPDADAKINCILDEHGIYSDVSSEFKPVAKPRKPSKRRKRSNKK